MATRVLEDQDLSGAMFGAGPALPTRAPTGTEWGLGCFFGGSDLSVVQEAIGDLLPVPLSLLRDCMTY